MSSFELTNNNDGHRTLHIEPLSLKFGLDPKDCYTIVLCGDAPFEMYLGDDDEGIYIEFQGNIDLKIMNGEEEIQSGYNLIF